MDGQPMRIGPCQNCHDDPCTCDGQYGENPIPPLHELQTARIAELENQLAEALKYGAPKNSKALSFVTHPCNFHSHYWTTMSGSCMACRAVSAETERDELRKQLADLRVDRDALAGEVRARRLPNGKTDEEHGKRWHTVQAAIEAVNASGALTRAGKDHQ